MIARKVYRNNEPSTATITNSTVDPNDTNTISESPHDLSRGSTSKTKIARNSQDPPFPIVDYFPLINPELPKKITEEGRKQMVELQKYATELMKKYNIKFDLKCLNEAVNPEKDV